MQRTLIPFLIAAAFLCGCGSPRHDLGRIHYGLTKDEIIACLGTPETYNYIIKNGKMLEACARQADLSGSNACKLRSAKIGDQIEECQWAAGEKVLVAKFLNHETRPALLWIVESDI